MREAAAWCVVAIRCVTSVSLAHCSQLSHLTERRLKRQAEIETLTTTSESADHQLDADDVAGRFVASRLHALTRMQVQLEEAPPLHAVTCHYVPLRYYLQDQLEEASEFQEHE